MAKSKFKTTISVTSIVFACLAACTTPSTLRIPDTQLIELDQDNIVSQTELGAIVEDQASASNLIYKATQRGYKVVKRNRLDGLKLHMIVFEIPPKMDAVKAIGELESLEKNTIAGVNHAYTLQRSPLGNTVPGDNYANYITDWPLNGCQPHEAIGVIDALMDESLAKSLGANLVQKDFSANGSDERKKVTHGNKVLAVIAGDGRLHNPTIYNASVISEKDTGTAGVVNILEALNWLAANNVQIVNISLAGPYNKLLDKGIRSSDRAGMRIIAAAGNYGPTSPPRYPAAFPEVLAVTAVDADNKVFKGAVRGKHIDFAAPGVDLKVKVGDEYGYVTGTSFASPFLSSMLATNPKLLDTFKSRKKMLDDGITFEDLGPEGFDEIYGHGLVKFSWDCDS